MPLRPLLSPFLLLLLTFGSFGCRSGSSVAREDFAKKHSCPDDRVTVTKRSDLTWDSLLPKESEKKPPQAIAEDPARLAKWASDQAKSKPQTDHYEMFEVSGCDVREYYGCTIATVSRNNRSSTQERACVAHPTAPK